jgi:hypothetical protein
MNKIFINIASYRDHQLIPTVRDAIQKARNPERISFGICWQHGPDEERTFNEKEDPLFQGIDLNYSRYDYRDSHGMGWARKISQSFLKDEGYQLQVDSHMRFKEGWDWHLLNLHERCKVVYDVKKPIITSRTLPYYPEKNDELKAGMATYMHASKFRENGVLALTSGALKKRDKHRECVPGAFISGHYMFSSSRIINEMPYDDKFAIISTGDEPILAVKAFTRGWDIFYAHKVIIWHHFFREDAKKNHNEHKGQQDHQSWKTMADAGVKRFNDVVQEKIPVGSRYGLGKERSLEDYKKYCGVDYKNRKFKKSMVFVDGVFKKEEKTVESAETPMSVSSIPSAGVTLLPKDNNEKIFVQIASYRDPDLRKTINDLVEKSAEPENLILGICDQYGPENDYLPIFRESNARVIRIPFYASPGLGWARHMIQKLYLDGDAKYTMQLDSHMRFAFNWDRELKNMIKATGSKKPIISHYCTAFTQDQKEQAYLKRRDLFKMYCLRFNDTGTISFRQKHVEKEVKESGVPGKSMWVSGHFYFTLAEHIREYPYDPNLYFAGDEISLAVRSWTKGWDIFHPSKAVVFHNYTREKRVCHWSDQKINYGALHEESLKRLRQMLHGEDHGYDLGEYGLGTERSLEDYERLSGINFKERVLTDLAKEGCPIEK